jgi:hypothetical protein
LRLQFAGLPGLLPSVVVISPGGEESGDRRRGLDRAGESGRDGGEVDDLLQFFLGDAGVERVAAKELDEVTEAECRKSGDERELAVGSRYVAPTGGRARRPPPAASPSSSRILSSRL